MWIRNNAHDKNYIIVKSSVDHNMDLLDLNLIVRQNMITVDLDFSSSFFFLYIIPKILYIYIGLAHHDDKRKKNTKYNFPRKKYHNM